MPAAEEAFVELMKTADAAAWNKSHSLPSKISTSVYYTARKTIRTLPRTGLIALTGKIPFVGSLVSLGATKIADKIRAKRIAAGVFAAQGKAQEAVAPADVKALAKAIADRTKKIDENFTKLSDAWDTLRASITTLEGLASGSNTTAQAWTTGFWNAAYAYGRVDHYNLKLADMIDDNNGQMEILSKFIEDSTQALVNGKPPLQDMFVAAYDSLVTASTPLLGRQGSSSSWS